MPYKNKKLHDYSDQVKEGIPKSEMTDWSKVPEVILPKSKMKTGPKTYLSKARPKGKDGWYPEEMRIEAVALYAAIGNCAEVASMLKMNAATLRKWKTTEWWDMMMRRVRAEGDEELDSKFSKIVNIAVDEINDRLKDGEYVYNPRTGKTVRVKPKMRDVAMVAATHLEKRQLLRGQPTSRTEKIDITDSLLRLANEFSRFTQAKEVVIDKSIEIDASYHASIEDVA